MGESRAACRRGDIIAFCEDVREWAATASWEEASTPLTWGW